MDMVVMVMMMVMLLWRLLLVAITYRRISGNPTRAISTHSPLSGIIVLRAIGNAPGRQCQCNIPYIANYRVRLIPHKSQSPLSQPHRTSIIIIIITAHRLPRSIYRIVVLGVHVIVVGHPMVWPQSETG